MKKEKIEALAQQHWNWIEGLQETLETPLTLASTEYLYKTAFIHGYKHAVEDNKSIRR